MIVSRRPHTRPPNTEGTSHATASPSATGTRQDAGQSLTKE